MARPDLPQLQWGMSKRCCSPSLGALLLLCVAACGQTYPAKVDDPSDYAGQDEDEDDSFNVLTNGRMRHAAEQSEADGCRAGQDCDKPPRQEGRRCRPNPRNPRRESDCLLSKEVCSLDASGCEVCKCIRAAGPSTMPVVGDSESGNVLEPPPNRPWR